MYEMRCNTQSASPAGHDAWHPINWLGANSFFMGDRKQAPSAPSQAAITRPNISANSDNFAESLNIRGIPSSKSGAPAISANVAEYQRNGVARQRNTAAEKHTFVNAEQNQKMTPQTGVLVTAALEQLLVCVSGRVGVGVGVGVGECA